MDKGGAAIHLDPPNHPFYPPNISWISTKRLLDIHDIFFPYLFFPPVHFKMCLIYTFLFFFILRSSLRKHSPSGARRLMAWYMTIILLAFGEDTLASREDIRAPLDMGDLSKAPQN